MKKHKRVMVRHYDDCGEPTEAELQAIDEAREAVRRGEVATDKDVEAVFAKHRRT